MSVRTTMAGALALAAISSTAAAGPPPATFALIVGANHSADKDLKPLQYADDDAGRYQTLFDSLGARTLLLTRLDDNSLRVLPGAAVAGPPDRRSLDAAVAQLAGEVRQARLAGRPTALYFIFAGHGNTAGGRAYLGLEDDRLTGEDIDRAVLRPIGADESHLIVDACYSYFLAHRRGPGGRARPVQGFSRLGGQLDRPDVGLLLSTSATRESHEWDGFQAGVFSHEVRSGLYGAADADGDGQISYREIGAFVVRANAAIANEQLRPDVFARPPQGSARLLDLRPGLQRGLVLDPRFEAAHYLIEDRVGNRLVDFHNAPGRALTLVRPAGETVFLRNVATGKEYEIAGGTGRIQARTLVSDRSPVRARGAAQLAFGLIFSLAFDERAVDDYRFPAADLAAPDDDERALSRWRSWAAGGALGAAALAGLGAAAYVIGSRSAAAEARRSAQVDAPALNRRVEERSRRAIGLGAVGAAATAAGLLLTFWPSGAATPTLAASPDDGGSGGIVGLVGHF